MSYNHVYPRCCIDTPDPSKSNDKPSASGSSGQFKLYQFFVFCVPIFFTFILIFVFYLFYLRPRRVNWSSIRMRSAPQISDTNVDIATVESGLKKEHREMLPIVVYNESFFVRDTQCAVCLGDYQADDRLQQIPACGHTFHIDCIDSWLSMHTTCPLCRLSLLSCHKSQNGSPDVTLELSHASSVAENDVPSLAPTPQACEETESSQFSGLRNGEPRTVQNCSEEDARDCQCADHIRELRDARIENEEPEHTA
ncbi:RING-H2 finger protein ATL7-like isoform X2 [Argentina anserina]|uniref:RING-H2 finger protein ATL7-like isoform X2 n=1 Tax=Argentina anserina TaxID=57926 RepID=UPI0021764C41|nr:RING-H2 finger protein ATL7-like isoform X2 [Potentilla anserina]